MDTLMHGAQVDQRNEIDPVISAMYCGFVRDFDDTTGYGFAWHGAQIIFIHRMDQGEVVGQQFLKYRDGNHAPLATPGMLVLMCIVESSPNRYRAAEWTLVRPIQMGERADAVNPVTDAEILNFDFKRGFGFALLSGGMEVFVHIGRLCRYVDEQFVLLLPEDRIPTIGPGVRLKLVLGKKRASGGAVPADYWAIAEPDAPGGAPAAADVEPLVVATARQVDLPKLVESDEIEVTVGKIKRDRTSYATSATYGAVMIPWSVMLAAGITNKKAADEVFVVRCVPNGDGKLTATHVRRR